MDNFIEIHSDYIKVREATKQGYAIARGGDSINLEQPNSKTRRGRVGRGIANTLTCSCNQGVVIEEEIDKMQCNKCGSYNLIEYGHLGIIPTFECECGNIVVNDKNKLIKLGNIYPSGGQNGNIYDSNGISPAISSGQGVKGNGIGSNNAPKVKINNNKENDAYMWKNDLENFNFKMEELQLVSLFSGIGAFEEGQEILGIPTNIKYFAEVEIDAIIDYAAIHIPNFLNSEFDYPSEDEMKEWLMKRNIGYDFEKGKSKIPRLKKDKLYKVYKASVLGNNLGDVSLISYYNFGQVDMIVGGSPCQDFSVAGKQKGSIWTCKECGHQYNPIEQHWSKRDSCPKCESKELDKTRSSLLVEYLRAVRELKPKYFIYENVKNIKGKGFIKIFNLFEEELKEYGYNTYNKVINAKNNGIPQNRERVFVVGIREDISCDFNFIEDFDNGIRLKDLLEEHVDEKYYLSDEIQKRFKLNGKVDINHNELNQIGTTGGDKSIGVKDIIHNNEGIATTLSTMQDINRQNKRLHTNNEIIKYFDIPKEILNDNERQRRVYSVNGISPTTLARTDNAKIINTNNLKIRKLTPLECWRLMGFRDESFEKAKSMGTSDSALYKQAGNSIVVNCLYYIFKELFKEYII